MAMGYCDCMHCLVTAVVGKELILAVLGTYRKAAVKYLCEDGRNQINRYIIFNFLMRIMYINCIKILTIFVKKF